MKLIRDELKFLLFNEIYFKYAEPKAKRKALMILEAAIQCLAKKGFDQVTAEMVAREAGVSRSLIGHYFKNVAEVERYALKYIRLLYQKLVVETFSQHAEPEKMLIAYVDACLSWTKLMPNHALVWIAFLQRCGRHPKRRAFNTTAVAVGTDRLAALLSLGVEQGVFFCADTRKSAKAIQVLITGAVISKCSENFVTEMEFIGLIQDTVLALTLKT